MKLFEQDDVARMEGRPEAQLHGSRIRIKVTETCYYSISVEDDGMIKIYKSGFPDDRINLTLEGANVLLIN